MEEFTPPSKEQIGFNAIWQIFVIEKRPPGADARNNCNWVTDDNTRCAVGWLIPTELTKNIRANTQQNVWHLDKSRSSIAMYLKKSYTIDFLQALEDAHDLAVEERSYPSPDFHIIMEEALRDVAEKFNLTIPGKE